MILDASLKEQLKQYFDLMENEVVIHASLGTDDKSKEMAEFIEEVTVLTPLLKVEKTALKRTPSFSLSKGNEQANVTFAAIPLGHEFTSFVLAVLQVSGRAPKIEDSSIQKIKEITRELSFETYVSLSCQICPDVVQLLNAMSVLNPNIHHTMIDGQIFQTEVTEKNIMAVPSVYLNGEEFESGRMTIEQVLDKIGVENTPVDYSQTEPFDTLVVGGGPGGISAAIYAARKGIKTGLVAEQLGGQILDTSTIENFIGTSSIEGTVLANQFKNHLNDYLVEKIIGQKAVSIQKNDYLELTLEKGAVIKARTIVLATGAKWRDIGVPGEKEYRTKGVAYCPHCDGPLFAGKPLAVIGGGNSGIEAALDLAGVASHVTVIEFLDELKADDILQQRLKELDNVTVITNAQTSEIIGDGTRVTGLDYLDRTTKEKHHLDLAGVFVQIGLVPKNQWVKDFVSCNNRGEIIAEKNGATNIPGVFAAGDCSDEPYKQVIVSMGSGAKAALGAFDYLMREGKK